MVTQILTFGTNLPNPGISALSPGPGPAQAAPPGVGGPSLQQGQRPPNPSPVGSGRKPLLYSPECDEAPEETLRLQGLSDFSHFAYSVGRGVRLQPHSAPAEQTTPGSAASAGAARGGPRGLEPMPGASPGSSRPWVGERPPPPASPPTARQRRGPSTKPYPSGPKAARAPRPVPAAPPALPTDRRHLPRARTPGARLSQLTTATRESPLPGRWRDAPMGVEPASSLPVKAGPEPR